MFKPHREYMEAMQTKNHLTRGINASINFTKRIEKQSYFTFSQITFPQMLSISISPIIFDVRHH